MVLIAMLAVPFILLAIVGVSWLMDLGATLVGVLVLLALLVFCVGSQPVENAEDDGE